MMPPAPALSLQDRLAGALDWWREAGVDHVFSDKARSWVAKEPAADAAAAPAPGPLPVPSAPRLGGERAGWPADLEAFQAWWLAEPALDPGPLAERVAPRGCAAAPLMLVVEHPEREDERLLSGREGALLDAFLGAAGIAPETAYVASALPRCTPLPDWPALRRDGLGDVLAHHIALAAPQRVILFGSSIPSLLDHDPAQNSHFLPLVNHDGRKVPVLVVPSLPAMLARPKLKRTLWERWLDWTE